MSYGWFGTNYLWDDYSHNTSQLDKEFIHFQQQDYVHYIMNLKFLKCLEMISNSLHL